MSEGSKFDLKDISVSPSDTESAHELSRHDGVEDRLTSYVDFLDYDIVEGFGDLLVTLRDPNKEVHRQGNKMTFNIGVVATQEDEEMDKFEYPCEINLDNSAIKIGEPTESDGELYNKETGYLGKDNVQTKIRNYIKIKLDEFNQNENLPKDQRRESF